MGFLFKTLAVGAIVAVAYPPINEGAGGPCHALEAKAFNILAKFVGNEIGNVGILGANITTGGMATYRVKEELPKVPPFLSCTLYYWLFTIDEEEAMKAIARMIPEGLISG